MASQVVSRDPLSVANERKQEIEQYENETKQDLYHDPALPQYPGVDAVAQQTLAEGRSPWKVIVANPRLLLLIMAVQSNAIIVGVEFSLPGNLLGIQSFCKLMGYYSEKSKDYQVEAQHLSVWAALFATFQVLGQFTGGELSDRFGRRVCLYSVILFTVTGVVIEVVANDWKQWLGSKIVVGFATGIMQSAVPTYVSEVSPREIRGIMLSFFNMAMNIGGLFATVVPWATTKAYPDVNDQRSFRIPLYIAVALPVITLVLELFLLVESPYWLMMRGRVADARKSIRFMYPKVSEEEIDMTCAQLAYTLDKETEEAELNKQTTYLDCFKGVDLRRTFTAVFPPITQNLSGQNLAGTYATYFFTLAKQKDPLISSVITTAVGLAANFASFFLIESKRVGRFFLLFTGVVIMTGCMLAIAAIDTAKHSNFDAGTGALLVFFVSLFLAASTIGPGVAGWAYTGESGSSRLRAKTTTLGTVGNAIVGLIMTTVLPYLLSSDYGAKWGAKTGYMFAGLGTVCIVLIWFFIPDLTGRSYAQIDELFARRIPARKFASTECTGDYGRDVTDRDVEVVVAH